MTGDALSFPLLHLLFLSHTLIGVLSLHTISKKTIMDNTRPPQGSDSLISIRIQGLTNEVQWETEGLGEGVGRKT